MKVPEATETVAAAATPRSPGAIGAVIVTGPAADAVVARVFRERGRERGGLRVGEIVSPSGEAADEAVVARLEPSRSGACRLEIGVHGGRGPMTLFLESLAAAGARVVETAAFRRFLVRRGDHDRIWLEASEALDRAPSLEGAAFLAAALSGALSDEIESIERALERGAPGARDALARLVAAAPQGVALARPPVVVLTGEPNAGKSTLFNAFVGAGRALTSPDPNTTRDALEEIVLAGRWPIRLVDTAGVGREETEIDRSASAMARRRAARADAVVRVVDGSREARALAPGRGPVAVTRADLPPAFALESLGDPGAGDVVRVSGATGEGIDRLADAIRRALGLPERPPKGPGLFSARQRNAARAALREPGGERAARRLRAARLGGEG